MRDLGRERRMREERRLHGRQLQGLLQDLQVPRPEALSGGCGQQSHGAASPPLQLPRRSSFRAAPASAPLHVPRRSAGSAASASVPFRIPHRVSFRAGSASAPVHLPLQRLQQRSPGASFGTGGRFLPLRLHRFCYEHARRDTGGYHLYFIAFWPPIAVAARARGLFSFPFPCLIGRQ